MPPARKRPGDLTGRKSEELQKKHHDELADRQRELSMIQATVEAEKLQPVDLSGPETTTVDGVEVKRAKKRVKAMSTFDATVGVRNNYSLEEGRTYDLPADVADHLLEKGLVWA